MSTEHHRATDAPSRGWAAPVFDAVRPAAGRPWLAMRPLLARVRALPTNAVHVVPRWWTPWVRLRRTAVVCAGWMLLIVLATLLLAVLVWRSMVEQRLAAPEGGVESRDLTASLSSGRGPGSEGALTAPDQTSTSGKVTAPPAPEQTSSGPDQVLLSGPAPAAAGALLIVVGGVAGGRFVLRRYRRAPVAGSAGADDVTGDVLEGADREAPSAADEELTPTGDSERNAPAVDAAVLVLPGAEIPVRVGADESSSPTFSTDGQTVVGTGLVDTPLPYASDDTGFGARRRPAEAGADGGRTSLLVGTPAGPAFDESDQPVISAGREVIYERRALPRIAYVAPGVLEWKDWRCPVTVLDLSESGLRCEISADEQTAVKPGNTEYVRISFALPSGWLDVKAQVAWNRRADGGTQFGLQFLDPGEKVKAQLTEVCLAGDPV